MHNVAKGPELRVQSRRRVAPSSRLLALSLGCAQIVESRWLSGLKLVCLTHNHLQNISAWGQTNAFLPSFSCSFSDQLPQQIYAFNSYVFSFSPSSTATIKATIK